MNNRIMNPVVGTARRRVSQYPTSRDRNMAYHRRTKGTAEVRSWITLRRVSAPQ